MEKVKDWNDILEEWDTFPIDAYKLMFSEVKENFEERSSDSESITNKSIKILALSSSFLVGLLGYTSSQDIYLCLLCLFCLAIPYFIILLLSIKLMFPKNIQFRGTLPSDIMVNVYDNKEYEESDKEKLLYYNTIKQYQYSIEIFDEKLKKRHCFYKLLLASVFFLFIISLLLIISI